MCAAPYSPFETTIRADPNFQLEENEQVEYCTEHPVVKRPTELFKDDVAYNLIISVEDSTRAAWNAWEMACKYKDEEKQDYYMKIIVECGNFMKKIRKL